MEKHGDNIKREMQKSSDKLSRRVGEKLRRDKLNGLITQLAEELPTIRHAQQRLDKSSILRLTVSYMKLHQGLKRKNIPQRSIFEKAGLLDRMKEMTDGTVFILTRSGTLLYVSQKVYEMLGYYQSEMIGYNLSQFVHPDDMEIFQSQFQEKPETMSSSSFAKFDDANDVKKFSNVETLEQQNVSFYLRLLRAKQKKKQNSKPNGKVYELLHIKAHCEAVKSGQSNTDELWMVANVKLAVQEPITELTISMVAFCNNNEWATMHSLDSKIISMDQSASLIIGYLASEMIGKTPYMFIIDEDLECVAYSHQLIMKDQEIPSTVFRMKNSLSIELYVQSKSIIINDRWTKQPKCIVSCNTALSEAEGSFLLQQQKQRMENAKALEQLRITNSDDKNETKSVSSTDKSESDDTDKSCNLSFVNSGEQTESNGSATGEFDPFNKDDIIKICENTNKSLCEVYDKKARHINDSSLLNVILSPNYCSNDSPLGIKRSIDFLDGELCSDDSQVSGCDGSWRQNEVATENELSSPELTETINATCCSNHIPQKSKTIIQSEISVSACQPILKSILESPLTLGQGRYIRDTLERRCSIECERETLCSDSLIPGENYGIKSSNCSSLACQRQRQIPQGSFVDSKYFKGN